MAGTGARVRLVEHDEVTPEARAAYEHVAAVRGNRMGNVFKAMANSVWGIDKVPAVGEYIRSERTDALLNELAICTVAAETRCMYEWVAHGGLAIRAGATPEQLAKIGTPEIEASPAPLGPALRFARLLAHGEEVDDATFDTLKQHLGEPGVVDLALTVGYYLLLSRFINVMRVPLEEGAKERPFPAK